MTRVRARPVRDVLERSGESVVLADGVVSRLSVPATLIRNAAAEWTDLDDVVAILVAELGEPPHGSPLQVTRAWVDELVDAGLLERDERPAEAGKNT